MRSALYCLTFAALAGCSTIDTFRDVWNWDVTQPQPRLVLSAPQLAELNAQIEQLRAERNQIRVRISGEPDIKVRQSLYADLHEIGMRLSPLERRLASTVAMR